MRRVAWAAGWLILLTLAMETMTTFCMATTAETVGVRGTPERLTIEGATTYTPQQIKDALFGDFKVFLAAGSSKPLDEYLRTIEQRITAGYRNTGFPTVMVSAALDVKTDHIIVKVSEGPRYLTDDIRVTGAKTIPTDKLIEYLTTPQPPKDATPKCFVESQGKTEPVWVDRDGKKTKLSDPVWTPGKPARFLIEPEEDSTLHGEVVEALAKLGYFFPKFIVDVIPDTATKKAPLVIDIADEGPKCLLNNVTITGNKLNTRKEILQYLAIKPDATLTNDELVRIKQLLWRSGRFIKHDVTPTPPFASGEPGELRIDLVELKGAPFLSKPFSPEEVILLKFRDWLANPDQWDGDLCMKFSGEPIGSAEFVFSPKHGVFAQIRYKETPTSKQVDYAAFLRPNEFRFHDLANGKCLSIPLPNNTKTLSFTCLLDENANNMTESRHRLILDGGVNSNPCDPKNSLLLKLIVDPVYAMDMAHDCDTTYDIHDGVLTTTNYCAITRIDTRSGRLLEMTLLDDKEDTTDVGKKTQKNKNKSAEAKTFGRIWFAPNEFQRRSKAVAASVGGNTDSFSSAQPVSSTLAFLCENDLFWQRFAPAVSPKARKVLVRMLDRKVCKSLDDLVCDYFGMIKEDDFDIPWVRSERDDAWMVIVAVMTHRITQRWFPADSWPGKLSRALILECIDQEDAAADDWKQLLSLDNPSPICSLVTAKIFGHNPSLADAHRSQGLQHLTIQDFHKEYPLLLDQKYPIGKCTRRAAMILRELDDEDIQSLSTILPDRAAKAFRQWATRWRKDRKQSTDMAIQELLDALWENGLRELVAEQFQAENPTPSDDSDKGKSPDKADAEPIGSKTPPA